MPTVTSLAELIGANVNKFRAIFRESSHKSLLLSDEVRMKTECVVNSLSSWLQRTWSLYIRRTVRLATVRAVLFAACHLSFWFILLGNSKSNSSYLHNRRQVSNLRGASVFST